MLQMNCFVRYVFEDLKVSCEIKKERVTMDVFFLVPWFGVPKLKDDACLKNDCFSEQGCMVLRRMVWENNGFHCERTTCIRKK